MVFLVVTLQAEEFDPSEEFVAIHLRLTHLYLEQREAAKAEETRKEMCSPIRQAATVRKVGQDFQFLVLSIKP